MKYLSIDVETAGLNPAEHDLLAVAIVPGDDSKDQTPEELARESLLLVLPARDGSIRGEVGAMVLHAESGTGILRRLERARTWLEKQSSANGWGPFEADPRGANWIAAWRSGAAIPVEDWLLYGRGFTENVVVAGKNVGTFDLRFFEKDHGLKTCVLSRFDHRVLDIGPMFLRSEDDRVPGMSKCRERTGVTMPPGWLAHDPLTDAVEVVLMVRAARKQREFAEESMEAMRCR